MYEFENILTSKHSSDRCNIAYCNFLCENIVTFFQFNRIHCKGTLFIQDYL